ncbi:hypothetical protein ACTXT7_017032 [Hymenolepis weldensis]
MAENLKAGAVNFWTAAHPLLDGKNSLSHVYCAFGKEGEGNGGRSKKRERKPSVLSKGNSRSQDLAKCGTIRRSSDFVSFVSRYVTDRWEGVIEMDK